MTAGKTLEERIGRELGPITDWSAGQILAQRAATCGDRTFLSFLPDERQYTYSEFHKISQNLAWDLSRLGISKGAHVGLMAGNSPEFVAAFYTLGAMGAVAVPVNTAAVGDLLRHYLGHADCTAIIIEAEFLSVLAGVIEDLPQLATIVVIGSRETPPIEVPLQRVTAVPFPRLRRELEKPWRSDGRFSDLMLLLYTSGTTGPSKAIMFTHASAFHWAADNTRYRAYESEDIDYVFMPLFHGNALLLSVTAAMMAGTSIALTRKFSASRFLSDVRQCRATRANLLGVVATFLWAQPPSPADRDHRLRITSVVPAPPFTHDFERRFGVKVLTGYGLTDYCMATSLTADDPADRVFSCGRARDGIEIRVVDEDDRDVPTGEAGEIALRSSVMWGTPVGYYKMAEETLASRRNLVFHTGDRGYLDAEGFLYFLDRKKDAIRRRGENISAYEVEKVILSHPAVEVAAVYPVRSANTEDEVAATVVIRRNETLSAAELASYCATRMGDFMVPRFIEFASELPLTPSQKVEKYKLKRLAETDLSRFWDRAEAI